MKSWMRLSILLSIAAFSVFANAEMKGCRYSKAAGQDEADNSTLTGSSCNTKICMAVVLCDNDTSISNVVCTGTKNGCPVADECLKQHQANNIVFGAFASTPYREMRPEPPAEGGAR